MKVKVKFFAFIREVAGVNEVEVEIKEGMTIMDLIKKLSERLPQKFRDFVFEGHEISKNIIILVNGKGISELYGLETKLKSGDEVALLPPVSGG
ncbi:MAG: ubiquitin-like small modifier protein 1 [Candidatus Nezhaarchaeales archaeon]